MFVSVNRVAPKRDPISRCGPTLHGKVFRKFMNTEQTSLRGMVFASLFGALTAVGAYIIIPLPPVPITNAAATHPIR